MIRLTRVLILLSHLFLVGTASAEYNQERIIAGWLEKVVLKPWQITLKAKLDSGAKTSSIHANNIQRFERDGRPWLRFDLPNGLNTNVSRRQVEMPILREALIKRHQLSPAKRPVVEIEFCIDTHVYKAQFTLADRGKFNYPVLLGRRFLKHHVLINSKETFLHSQDNSQDRCQENEDKEHVVSLLTAIPSDLNHQAGH